MKINHIICQKQSSIYQYIHLSTRDTYIVDVLSWKCCG